ncbi:MAG: DUF2062 domain-containing protein [Bacteroidales bacterium]
MIECRDKVRELGCAVLIPTYNNCTTILQVIDDVLQYSGNIFVVNDGSTDTTKQILEKRDDITLISYSKNRGKGHAIKVGLECAIKAGFNYLITIDSDGQHYAKEIPLFIQHIEQNPNTLIIGARNLNANNMPGKNTFANKFSNFWYKVETGITLSDTQSGYRLYPLVPLKNMRFITSRYEFEVEVIVRLAWKGIKVINIPIEVYYPCAAQRISHFRPLQDFTRISILNTFLVLAALIYYYPKLFIKSLNIKTISELFNKHIRHSKESDRKIALSVGLGIFCGIIPLWGYQMITAGILAYFLKLNKVISIASSNISIPPMIPFILYGSLLTGGVLLGVPTFTSLSQINLESISTSMAQYIIGSIVLAIISAIIIGIITFITLKCFRRETNG